MRLSSVFSHVMHKELVAGELPNRISNQHELNGTGALKNFFGVTKPVRGEISWHYFSDDQEEPSQAVGGFTFYDSRAKSAARTKRSPEWRFYYFGNFLECAQVGDWAFLARTHSGQLFGLVFQHDSSWLRAA